MQTAATINDAELTAAFRAARQIARAGAGDLYFACYFLPRQKRRAVDAVGAFCAMIVDALALPENTLAGARAMREHPVVRTSVPLQQLPPQNAGANSGDACDGDTLDTRLAMLRERIDEIYDGRLELPAVSSRSPQQHALLALSFAVKEFPVDRRLFLEFANACRALDVLAAAGAVGQMISGVLGMQHSEGRRYAMALGRGIALCRMTRVDSPANSQIDLARRLIREGAEGICWLADDGSRLAVATATVTSAAMLAGSKPVRGIRKLLLLKPAVKLARRMDDQPMPPI